MAGAERSVRRGLLETVPGLSDEKIKKI